MESSTSQTIDAQPRISLPRELVATPVLLLMRLGFEVKGRAIEQFGEEGFTPFQFGVLALLEEAACGAQATIADTLGLDRSQLVGLLDSLEERGLIERRRDPQDRRRQVVSLTGSGHAVLVRLRAIVSRIQDDFLEPLDSAD